jgi:hypothetical protein
LLFSFMAYRSPGEVLAGLDTRLDKALGQDFRSSFSKGYEHRVIALLDPSCRIAYLTPRLALFALGTVLQAKACG